MKNTQSFNTSLGIKKIRHFYSEFSNFKKQDDRKGMAYTYDAIAKSCNLFPPCSVVSSLKNDIQDYYIDNIPGDLKVIENSRDKIKY